MSKIDELEQKIIKQGMTDEDFAEYQKILKRELPYTIGGGIGQSRILMLLLEKSHIAEVQASSWEEKTLEKVKTMKVL